MWHKHTWDKSMAYGFALIGTFTYPSVTSLGQPVASLVLIRWARTLHHWRSHGGTYLLLVFEK